MFSERDFKTLSAQIIEQALTLGADAADILCTDNHFATVNILNGALEHVERGERIDIGLRVIVGQRQACVSTSDIGKDMLNQMAERGVAMAKEAPEDEATGLADPDQLVQHWDIAALDLADPAGKPELEVLQETAKIAEAAALSVKGIGKTQGANAGWHERSIYLAASNGFQGGYRRTTFSTTCSAIAGVDAKMERDYCSEIRTHYSDLPKPEDIGRKAGERAAANLGAHKPPTGRYPVLFDERVASTLIDHVLTAINGTAIVRGSSWLKEGLHTQVFPDNVTLVEDPLKPRLLGSKPFDAEGLPVSKRSIIESGILTGWILDLTTGRKLNMPSTGNATRSVSHPPTPSAGNIILHPGAKSRDALIADMGTGLLVTGLIGSTLNPTTGDYSRGANGFWVENGGIQYPVNGCTIAGNLKDMLIRIIPANDGKDHKMRNVPSLLIESMTLAGQ